MWNSLKRRLKAIESSREEPAEPMSDIERAIRVNAILMADHRGVDKRAVRIIQLVELAACRRREADGKLDAKVK